MPQISPAGAESYTETEKPPEGVLKVIKIPKQVCLSDEKRAEIQSQLQIAIEELRAEGKLAGQDSFLPPQFIFPVRGNGAAANDYGIHAITNFVDHNPNSPNLLRDYNCGVRTYDTSTLGGYNHRGIDIINFPFYWNKMDNNEVVAVAAAAGVIIRKDDGNFDRNCSGLSGNDTPNMIFVRYGDGSVSWYAHLKKNSLTTKNIGDFVTQGEYLGVVGSSGLSTAPHLHFETYNSANVLQDPYQGACNLMNNFSYWLNQPAYYDSKINKLMTHSALPEFPSCPNPEITNEKNIFAPGNQVYLAAYYRDLVAGQQTQISVIQPGGTIYQTWTTNSPGTYDAAYWAWTILLPANAQTGDWKFRVSYNSQIYEHTFYVRAGQPAKFDFDGDGKSDYGVFRPSNGAWYLQRSQTGFAGVQFGTASDRLAPADYDGDGKTDIAVYRDGTWYLQRSQSGFTGINFGGASDIPVPADYTGDGRAELAVFRPSNGAWYIFNLSNNQFTATQFGQNGDKPVPADYDADGKADIAVFRDGVWYLQRTSQGFIGVQFGQTGDKAAPADYDGDGKADVAVYRNGIWYLQRSQAGFLGVSFGASNDIPVASDYDGDGKVDVSVWRPAEGTFYVLRSSGNQLSAYQFGANGDLPVVSTYIQ